MQIITQSGDLGPKWFHIALRAMVLMAKSDTILKSKQIAEILGEEATSVRKILAKLAKAQIVAVYEGRYGGYCLKAEAENITVLDVYKAFETPVTPIWTVPSTGSEKFISLIVSRAEERFQSELKSYTIKDILNYINE